MIKISPLQIDLVFKTARFKICPLLKKFICLFLLVFGISFSGKSQALKSKYERNVVSIGTTFSKNEGNIDWDKITPAYLETTPYSGFIVKKENILKSLNDDKIPNNIIKSILFDSNGDINYKYIFNRGEYNAIDSEIAMSKLANEGFSLIQNSGFNVLDNIHIIIYEEYLQNEVLFKRFKYRAYLYKILIDKNSFWNEVIDKTNNKLILEKLDNYKFDLELVAKKSSNKIERSFYKLGSIYKPLLVKSNILLTSPISAKIGTKEGLRVNDLFQVLENKQTRNDSIIQISKGYVRVKSLADNSTKSNGKSNSSTFYKTFSGSLDKGMILRSVPKRGIFFGASKLIASDNKSLLNGYLYQVDYISHKYKGLYYSLGLGISDTIQAKSYILPGGIEKKELTAVLSGLNIIGTVGKTIAFNFIEISPEIGLYTSSYSINRNLYNNIPIKPGAQYYVSKDKESVTPFAFITGLKLGLNLGRSMQIYGSVNYIVGNSTYNLTSSEKLSESEKTKLTFNNLPTFKIGLRLFQL